MTPDKFNTVINEIKYADYNEIQQIVEIIRIKKETLNFCIISGLE